MEWVLLDENAIEPRRATKFSAGYDICANETVLIRPNGVKLIKTGISFKDLAKNHYLEVTLRSSFSINRPFIQPNGYGVIDSDYAGGEIGVILWNRGNVSATVDKGERLAQIIELPYYTAKNEIEPTKERIGGYGSTND